MTSAAPHSEALRHACEVRYVVGLPDHAARARYLARVAEYRGGAVAERLRHEAWIRLQQVCP